MYPATITSPTHSGRQTWVQLQLGQKSPKEHPEPPPEPQNTNRRYHRTGSGNSMSMISLEGVKGQVSASDQGHLTGAEAFNWLQNNMVSVMSLGGT